MVSLVQFNDPDALQRRMDDAQRIREYADKVESGDIINLVIVCNNVEDNCYESFGIFRDKWYLLGALEYAKNSVNGN